MARAAIYTDNNFGSEVKGFSVLRVKVHAPSRLIGAPIETGHVIFDNKVLDPTTIIVVGTIDTMNKEAENSASQIMEMQGETNFKLLSLSDGAGRYNNLILQSFTSERTTEKIDLVYYTLEYKEVFPIDVGTDTIQSIDYSNIVPAGFQQGEDAQS